MMTVLLDGTIVARSPSGEREIAAAEFFDGALMTTLGEDEIVTEVQFPALPAGHGWGFEEVAQRSGDYAIAAAAATVTANNGVAGEVRLTLMGVGETPSRMAQAEALLTGTGFSAGRHRKRGTSGPRAVEPMSDLHASADYRRHLAEVLTRRTLRAAWTRANGETP